MVWDTSSSRKRPDLISICLGCPHGLGRGRRGLVVSSTMHGSARHWEAIPAMRLPCTRLCWPSCRRTIHSVGMCCTGWAVLGLQVTWAVPNRAWNPHGDTAAADPALGFFWVAWPRKTKRYVRFRIARFSIGHRTVGAGLGARSRG